MANPRYPSTTFLPPSSFALARPVNDNVVALAEDVVDVVDDVVTLPPLFLPPSSFALARPVNDDVVALAEDVVDVDVADDVVTLPTLFLPPPVLH